MPLFHDNSILISEGSSLIKNVAVDFDNSVEDMTQRKPAPFVGDDNTDCCSTLAEAGTDDREEEVDEDGSSSCQAKLAMFDLYQDRFVSGLETTTIISSEDTKKNTTTEVVEPDTSSYSPREYFEDGEGYFYGDEQQLEEDELIAECQSNTMALFYSNQKYFTSSVNEEEGYNMEEQAVVDPFEGSFQSDAATICGNESISSVPSERHSYNPNDYESLPSEEVSYCVRRFPSESSSYRSTTADWRSVAPASSHCSSTHYLAVRDVIDNLLQNTSSEVSYDEATPRHLVEPASNANTCGNTPYYRVAFPSCTPPPVSPSEETLRSALMPVDPTNGYRKLVKTHGKDLASNVDLVALLNEHEAYVGKLFAAAPHLSPSPFPFYNELKEQQHNRTAVAFLPASNSSLQNSVKFVGVELAKKDCDQHLIQRAPMVRPMMFLPPPPPSMQTLFVAQHTFERPNHPFPTSELVSKPNTGDFAAGFGPEYSASVEDGLPASREEYDPNSDAFASFYAILMRWYDNVCRVQEVHRKSSVGNQLIGQLTPVPDALSFMDDFVGWVRALNKWWEQQVQPLTGAAGSVYPLLHLSVKQQSLNINQRVSNGTFSRPCAAGPPPLASDRLVYAADAARPPPPHDLRPAALKQFW